MLRILSVPLFLLLCIQGTAQAVPITMDPDPLEGLVQGAYIYELDLISADTTDNVFTFHLNATQLSTTGQGVNFTFSFDQSISSCAEIDQGGYDSLQCIGNNIINLGVPAVFAGPATAIFELTLVATPTILTVDPSFGDERVATFSTAAVPLPAALPVFATGLGLMGFLGWRRKNHRSNDRHSLDAAIE